MRKAGEKLGYMGSVGKEAEDAIQRAADDFSPQAYELASHSVNLNTGKQGMVNDGINKSYILKDGDVRGMTLDIFENPLRGQGAGARELRDMTPRELKHYHQMFDTYRPLSGS